VQCFWRAALARAEFCAVLEDEEQQLAAIMVQEIWRKYMYSDRNGTGDQPKSPLFSRMSAVRRPTDRQEDTSDNSSDESEQLSGYSSASSIDLNPATPSVSHLSTKKHDMQELQQRLLRLPEQEGFLEIRSQVCDHPWQRWWACTETCSQLVPAQQSLSAQDGQESIQQPFTEVRSACNLVICLSPRQIGGEEPCEQLSLLDLQAVQAKSGRQFILMDAAGNQHKCRATTQNEAEDWILGRRGGQG
jgi:hypothetical protein